MTSRMLSPSFNLEGFRTLRFSYDREDDIALVHLDGPRPAITTELEDGWHLRTVDGEIVGLELHGFQRIFMSMPFFASVSRPAIEEIEKATGMRFVEGEADVVAEGSTEQLPRTTHLVILMVGQAIAKYEAFTRAGYAEAGRRYFSEGHISAPA